MATQTGRSRARTTVGTSRPRGAQESVHVYRPSEEAAHNPLRAGLRLEKVPEPCVIVVFGATGDLTSRKILPAVYNLRRAGLLPAETCVLGFSRRPLTDDAPRIGRGEFARQGRGRAVG
jgi:Glucose-6-phosphate dehydrogenase, NAD binding domain